MDNQEFVNDFIKSYQDLVASSDHKKIKDFNRNLAKYAYFLVYPFKYEQKDHVQLLVGFADSFEIHPFGNTVITPDAMSQLKAGRDFIRTHENFHLSETLAIPTSNIHPIPLKKIEWLQLINAPKLEDDSFSVLEKSFLEHFNLDEYAYQDDSEDPVHFGKYFNNDNNKPEDLELHVVWHDVDSSAKYGSIQTLILWKGEFIGWVTRSGRWIDTYSFSTVNVDKWNDLMDTIYKNSGYKQSRTSRGVHVYDMTKDEVDDVAYIPGFSIPTYSS